MTIQRIGLHDGDWTPPHPEKGFHTCQLPTTQPLSNMYQVNPLQISSVFDHRFLPDPNVVRPERQQCCHVSLTMGAYSTSVTEAE